MGVVAGVINTLAGGGSLITLPVLLLLGLSPHEANATNRVGVILQSVSGLFGVWRGARVAERSSESAESQGITGVREGREALEAQNLTGAREVGELAPPNYSRIFWRYIGPPVVGAALGAYCATLIDANAMRWSILAAMVLMLVLLLIEPNRWLRESEEPDTGSLWGPTALIAVGFYGGFVQAGVGVLLLAALVLGCGRTLIQANVLKLWIVLIGTVPALAVFIYYDQVRFAPGFALAFGQMIGAYLAGHYVSRIPNAQVWIRRLLIAVSVIAIVRLLW